MENAQIRALLGGHLTDLLTNLDELPVELRPYQVETLESATRWLLDSEGSRRAYVNYATGLGKTVVFASMIRAAAGLRVLVIVPTKVLLVQTARVIAQFTNGMLGHLSSLANIKDASGETVAVRGLDHSAVVVTTDASFNRHAAQIMSGFDPHLILRDECHWGYDDAAIAAMNQFDEAVIIGFSATPDYLTNQVKDGYVPVELENGLKLYGPLDRFADTHFQTCLDRRTLGWGIGNAWLCPLAWGRIEFDVDLKKIPVVDGSDGPDFDEGTLQKVMRKHWSVMCETIRRLYENGEYDLANRQVYAICSSVKDAEELAQTISSLGISTGFITGATSEAEREILLQAFRDNEIRFLSSVMVLREGWDSPNAEVCMMLRPTKSRVLYEQAIGRGLRQLENGGFKVALVLDAHFQGPKFSPLSAPILFGKPGDEIRMGDILVGPGGGVRGGEGVESPFLPKDAEPRIVVIDVCEPDVVVEPKVGADGFVEIDNHRFAPIAHIAKLFRLSHDTVGKRVKRAKLESIKGRDRVNKSTKLFEVESVKLACADLLEKLPQADDNNTFIHKHVEYATIKRIGALFDRDEATIKTKVAQAELKDLRGKDRIGRVQSFYSIKEVRKACDSLLEELPTIGEDCPLRSDGTFTIDGESWGTINVFMNSLNLSRRAINARISRAGCESRRVRDVQCRAFLAFRAEDVQSVCNDLLVVKLKLDDQGFVHHRGKLYGHVRSIAKMFGVSQVYVSSLIRNHEIDCVSAKNDSNRVTSCYDVETFRKLAAEKLKTTERLDPDGQVMIEGIAWISRFGAKNVMNVSYGGLIKRLQKQTLVQVRKAIDVSGHVVEVYPLEALRSLCLDLTAQHPELDAGGYTTIENKRWGSIRSLMKEFRVSEGRLWSCIARANVERRTARLRKIRRPVDIFQSDAVKQALRNHPKP